MTVLNVSDYHAGDSLVIEVTVNDQSGPVDLTGASLLWGVAPLTVTSVDRGVWQNVIGSVLTTKTVNDGIDILSAVNGTIQITLDAGHIMTAGTYHHELEVRLPTGLSHTPLTGVITAIPALFPGVIATSAGTVSVATTAYAVGT